MPSFAAKDTPLLRLRFRSFHRIVLAVLAISFFSLLASAFSFNSNQSRTPPLSFLAHRNDPPACLAVHRAADQCAFVLEHCLDQTAGLLPYLRLFYCDLNGVKPLAFVVLVTWLGLLFSTIGLAASDFFSINLSTISSILGLSESLAGVTILAFGNGSPDLFSTFAAMGSGSADMAIGELIGAACFITAVVAGSMAVVHEIHVDRRTFVRDLSFFAIAVALTTGVLADGKLYLWECCLMIGYYAVYVATVVGWHWISARRKKEQRQLGGQGDSSDDQVPRNIHGDPNVMTSSARSCSSAPLRLDCSPALGGPAIENAHHFLERDDDEEEEERIMAAEVTANMRVIKPSAGNVRLQRIIRPSLIGALEFSSLLSHAQSIPHPLTKVPLHRCYTDSMLEDQPTYMSLAGALSENGEVPSPQLLAELRSRTNTASSSASAPPGLTLSSPSRLHKFGGNLAPPPNHRHGLLHGVLNSHRHHPVSDASFSRLNTSPTCSRIPDGTSQPEEDSMLLPETSVSYETFSFAVHAKPPELTQDSECFQWWPYRVLPPFSILCNTLFPTLQDWNSQSFWGKLVSAMSIPSVLLLVLTLPVVDEQQCSFTPADPSSSTVSQTLSLASSPGSPTKSVRHDAGLEENESQRFKDMAPVLTERPALGSPVVTSAAGLPGHARPSHISSSSIESSFPLKPEPSLPGTFQNANHEWNRWLVAVQLVVGPQFAVCIIWANVTNGLKSPSGSLLHLALWTLLGSVVLVAALLLCTNVSRRPKYHHVLCFLGFFISTLWISTIAGEVVGVLKALGVILNTSEAILGLTVFAAGNSVGDLVANITMARLGFPVMALSACFGSPMLNILLGIGIGGTWMMITQANHKHAKHPDWPVRYKPYCVEVGSTLLISASTLLLILLALLVLVSRNRWIMSKRIGIGLISLWSVSTAVILVLELIGKGS